MWSIELQHQQQQQQQENRVERRRWEKKKAETETGREKVGGSGKDSIAQMHHFLHFPFSLSHFFFFPSNPQGFPAMRKHDKSNSFDASFDI